MVSRELAKLSEEFVMTVGVGDDLVMRVGIDSVEDLRSNMLHVLHACRLPKVSFERMFARCAKKLNVQ
jgi:sn1-specific diacylglycerol lipase